MAAVARSSWWVMLLAVAAAAFSEARSRSAAARTAAFASPRHHHPTSLCETSTSRVPRAVSLRPKRPSSAVRPSSLAMSNSPNMSLQEQIILGATMKLMKKESEPKEQSTPASQPPAQVPRETKSVPEGQYTYYVREGQRSEIEEITDTLMDSFHPNYRPAFDSYIRRYKYNHLKMCFDAMDKRDRGLFVACAVPVSLDAKVGKEQIVGFCSVDGRDPDPSCKIEFLTPSTLAGTSPRPYLSDLGVSTLHQSRGIGKKLVQACEEWTHNRGYETLYLKVERKNEGAVGLYSGMGYRKTKLPWSADVGRVEAGSRWDTTILMEKSVNPARQKERRKRTWIKNQLWKPIKESVSRMSSAPPL